MDPLITPDAASASGVAGDSAKPFRVLALDGGGIRGYYTTRLLEHLVVGAGGDPSVVDFGAAFDLIVGTSTGALIGAALASGATLARVSTMYRVHGPAIFPRPAPIGRASLPWCTVHWGRPSGSVGALRAALLPLYGAETLGGLHARRGIALCVTVTDVRTVRGQVLATPHAKRHLDAAAVAVVEACVASAAAPMLLPPARVQVGGEASDRCLCDGGLWAASPVLVAFDEALALAPPERAIDILSVSTCPMPVPSSVVARPRGTGIGFWIRGLRALQVAADSQAVASVEFVERVLPVLGRTVRLVRLKDPVPSDVEAARVRLDRATPDAFAAMEHLAEAAAQANGSGPGALVKQPALVAELLRELAPGAATV